MDIDTLNIALFQTAPIWESPSENLAILSQLLDKFFSSKNNKADIVIFPEFFTTGFSMNRAMSEKGNGTTLQWMINRSKTYGVAIVGSIPIEEGDNVYNRCFFVTPEGAVYHYDKRHLFRMCGENNSFRNGSSQLIVNYLSWNIALNICYDLRFPVWQRCSLEYDYDIMINVASWPSARIAATEILTKARAIENQSYFAFANRVGENPDMSYSGGSRIVDYKGNDIHSIINIDGYDIFTASLSKSLKESFKHNFPAFKDADTFRLDI